MSTLSHNIIDSSCDASSNDALERNGAYIDWLGFTISIDDVNQIIPHVMRWVDTLGGGRRLPFGRSGYSDSFEVCGSGRVSWNMGRVDMGVHVELPSSALALLPDGIEPIEMLRIAVNTGAKITRLDVAMDTDTVTVQDVKEAYFRRELVTRATEVDYTEKLQSASGFLGATLYIGSRKASTRRFCRIYDKAAEQGVDGVWTRCEVQHRAEYAHTAATHLLSGSSVADIIHSFLSFRSGADSNKSRNPLCQWWERWIGAAVKLAFARKKIEQSIEEALDWVGRQVGPVLAMLTIAGGDSRAWLFDVIDSGFRRLGDDRRYRAKTYQKRGLELSWQQ